MKTKKDCTLEKLKKIATYIERLNKIDASDELMDKKTTLRYLCYK